MVRRIKNFRPQLQARPLAQTERLVHRKVERHQARTDQSVSSQIAVEARRGQRKCHRVKVFVGPAQDRVSAASCHQVWTLW